MAKFLADITLDQSARVSSTPMGFIVIGVTSTALSVSAGKGVHTTIAVGAVLRLRWGVTGD